MDAEIVSGNIGPEMKYDLAFTGGKLMVTLAYDGADMGASIGIGIKAGAVLDALAAAIPGKFDDAMIAEVKALLGV